MQKGLFVFSWGPLQRVGAESLRNNKRDERIMVIAIRKSASKFTTPPTESYDSLILTSLTVNGKK